MKVITVAPVYPHPEMDPPSGNIPYLFITLIKGRAFKNFRLHFLVHDKMTKKLRNQIKPTMHAIPINIKGLCTFYTWMQIPQMWLILQL